jgi:hypothetical protein
MSAAYLKPRVEWNEAARKASVAFEIRNGSEAPWRAAEGFAVGYHLFDTLYPKRTAVTRC